MKGYNRVGLPIEKEDVIKPTRMKWVVLALAIFGLWLLSRML